MQHLWFIPSKVELGIAVFGLAACAWFGYFCRKEQSTKPLWWKALALLGGYLAVLAAVFGYRSIEALGCSPEWAVLEGGGSRALGLCLIIGFVEEGAKMLPVVLLAVWSRRFDRPVEGLFFAACAGVGFATAENTSLWMSGELSVVDGLARAVAAPVTHALFAAPWGLGLGGFLLRRKPSILLLGFAASVVSHGAYDLLLARAQGPSLAAALLVLALWIWLIVHTSPPLRRRLRALRTSGGPAAGALTRA